MATRKPRKKLSKKLDLVSPVSNITLEQLGTADDPCFGKLFDPKTDECSRCGDSEICAIRMMQNNTLKRASVEGKSKFKDIEEKNDPLKADPIVIKKMVRRRIKELMKLKMKPEKIAADVHATYNAQGYSIKRVLKIINIINKQ